MPKNTLFHNKKTNLKSTDHSKQQIEKVQIFPLNPENQAKNYLLEISEQTLKGNSHQILNSLNANHFRSYSTEFFNYKKRPIDSISGLKYQKNSQEQSLNHQSLKNKNSLKSVCLKSTFSNQMKRKSQNNFYNTNLSTPFSNNNSKSSPHKQSFQRSQKFRKTSYFPMMIQQQKQIQKIDQIFKSQPSKQIISFLKKNKLLKDLIVEIPSNQQSLATSRQTKSRNTKKSIFNIRGLLLKNQQQSRLSPQKSTRNLSPQFTLKGQMHSSCNKTVIKLRLTNIHRKCISKNIQQRNKKSKQDY